MKFLTALILTVLAPIIALATPPEICGDGVDNDGSGSDLACPAPDADNDLYRSTSIGGKDCDDNDRYIYPGVYVNTGEENLLTDSEAWDDSGWTKVAVTVNADQINDPDGNAIADLVTENSDTANNHYIRQLEPLVAGRAYKWVLDAKTNGRDVSYQLYQSSVFGYGIKFELSDCSVSSVNGSWLRYSATALNDDGWCRLSATFIAPAGATDAQLILYLTDNGTLNYNGDGSSGVYLGKTQFARKDASSVTTTAATVSSDYDWNQCQADGTYSDVTAATSSSNFFTCHTGSGETIFIDPSGSNSNSGLTPALAYLDFTNLHRTTGSNPYQAGDCIVLMGGVHTWTPMTDDQTAMFPFRITDGTADNPITLRGYPGEEAVIDMNGATGHGISVIGSDYVNITDLSITGADNDSGGIVTEDASYVVFDRIKVYDNLGIGSNTQGLRITRCAAGCEVNNIWLLDNYKVSGAPVENAANITIFDSRVTGRNIVAGYTDETKAQFNMKVKHADSSDYSRLAFTNVVLYNGSKSQFSTSAPVALTNFLFHGGNEYSIGAFDLGDSASKIADMLFSYGTIVDSDEPIYIDPSGSDVAVDGAFEINNVVTYNTATAYGQVDLAWSDATNINTLIDTLTLDNNCYYDGASPEWSVARSDGGAIYTSLAAWQAATKVGGGAFTPDANSYFEDPSLDSHYIAQSTNCIGKGWRGNVTYLDTLSSGSSGLAGSSNTYIINRRRLRY